MSAKVNALIPLRGGSKGIPGKNIKEIAGKPLCAWVLEAAVESGCFDSVLVSTESSEIKEVIRQLNLDVEVIDRPDHLATDDASTESVMLHAIEQKPCNILVTLQATSPLTTAQDLKNALSQFKKKENDSMLSGVPDYSFYWHFNGQPLNYDPQNRPRRQEFRGTLKENGAFYITKSSFLKEKQCRLGGNIGVYVMPQETATEIDEPEDWSKVENLLLQKYRSGRDGTNIRLLAIDVDGTLTDGGMYYNSDGEAMKKFNTRDAKGLELLRNKGIEVAVITAEDSGAVRSRMNKLQIQNYYPGIRDKLSLLQNIAEQKGLKSEEVAYMGDDLNDLDCLKWCGYAGCPSDAEEEVRQQVDYTSKLKGGEAAVRDFCNQILIYNED